MPHLLLDPIFEVFIGLAKEDHSSLRRTEVTKSQTNTSHLKSRVFSDGFPFKMASEIRNELFFVFTELFYHGWQSFVLHCWHILDFTAKVANDNHTMQNVDPCCTRSPNRYQEARQEAQEECEFSTSMSYRLIPKSSPILLFRNASNLSLFKTFKTKELLRPIKTKDSMNLNHSV